MSTKTTAKKSAIAKPTASKKTITNKAGEIKGVTNLKIIEQDEPVNNNQDSNIAVVNNEVTATSNKAAKKNVKSEAPAKKVAKVTKNISKKSVEKKAVSKSVATNEKKIKLAASCYHYYRNWLKDFMRSHGVSSARFQKSEESYDGHITVVESEKAKGLKALEQWNKENPDTKEMFWEVKK